MVGGQQRGYLLPSARKPSSRGEGAWVFSHLSRATSEWTLLPAVATAAVSLAQKEDRAFGELLELAAEGQPGRGAPTGSSTGSGGIFPAVAWGRSSLRISGWINPHGQTARGFVSAREAEKGGVCACVLGREPAPGSIPQRHRAWQGPARREGTLCQPHLPSSFTACGCWKNTTRTWAAAPRHFVPLWFGLVFHPAHVLRSNACAVNGAQTPQSLMAAELLETWACWRKTEQTSASLN